MNEKIMNENCMALINYLNMFINLINTASGQIEFFSLKYFGALNIFFFNAAKNIPSHYYRKRFWNL